MGVLALSGLRSSLSIAHILLTPRLDMVRPVRLPVVQLFSNHDIGGHSRGKEFLFFALFSIMGKTSAFIGPIVSSAIIDASPTGNNSLPFYFLFGISLASFCLLAFFVDLKKSRIEQEEFLEAERRAKERRASVIAIGEVGSSSSESGHVAKEKANYTGQGQAPEIKGMPQDHSKSTAMEMSGQADERPGLYSRTETGFETANEKL